MLSREQLDQLLGDMSLEEKIGQMIQLTGYYFTGSGVETGPASEMRIPEDILKSTASVLNVTGAKRLKEVQENYIKENPHRIPLVFMADVIHGFRTVFPIPLAQGCSFDPQLVKECASVAARESAAAGLHVTFSPMADLVRDPRWGRCMESTGEDVYLNGQMARAAVEGYQGESLTDEGTIGACLKHFAGYGAAEGGRDYNTVDMSELSLREQYLPAYREAVKAGTALVMTSFNTVNGIPASANRWLNEEILRKEWGFDGVLISDYSAIYELIFHGVAENEEEAGKLAVEAGVDMDMVSPVYGGTLKKMAEEGRISEELIDRSARRVLELKNRLGLFDSPFRSEKWMEREEEIMYCECHRRTARKMAEESMVLLKNDGILPVRPENLSKKTVALIGPYARSRELGSVWSMFLQEEEVVNLEEGFNNAFTEDSDWMGIRLLVEEGAPILDPGEELTPFKGPILVNDWKEKGIDREEALARAVKAAKEADVVILALGEHKQYSGEGASKASLRLSKVQQHLFEEVNQANPNTVVVLFSGRPLIFPEIKQKAAAVLQAWRPGTEGGDAVARVLTGKVNPSGRLSMSFPKAEGQIPVYYNHLRTGRPAQEGSRERFVSTYRDLDGEPAYPFGYGLSYTEFSYGSVSTNKEEYGLMEEIQACVVVENTGKIPGYEVVQCYVQDMVGSTARPVRELKGFKRIWLEPGEKETVSFTITEEQTRMITGKGTWETEPGTFRIYIGKDSRVTDNFKEVIKR